jgi:adenylate kinase
MGPPGGGKGTQAERLRDHLSVPHVSTGDILRAAVKDGTPVGRRAKEFVDSGQLVPDDVMGELIVERLGKDDAKTGFLLDGFPRSVEQVHILDDVVSKLGVRLDKAFILVAPESEIVRRLTGRRTCPKCGSVYHVESRPPKAAGVCDSCGSALVQRPDDTEEVIRKRLEVYKSQTVPVAAAYRERGMLEEIDGTGDPETVFRRIRAGLS